jgi:hypothetical protein
MNKADKIFNEMMAGAGLKPPRPPEQVARRWIKNYLRLKKRVQQRRERAIEEGL